MTQKHPLSDIMRELTASAAYRKGVKEMRQLHSKFSTQRYIYLFAPNEQTIEMFTDQGFEVTRTAIKEYIQYKVSW